MAIPSSSSSKQEFPTREVIILALCVTVNSYTLVNLFPYVGIMVKELMGLESTNEAGFYAGYVASSFSFGRLVAGYPIGYASDKIGRKPVIIAGLSSVMVFSIAFGLSPSFQWAITSRLLLGLMNGIMAASRTTVREICGKEHVMIGMSYVSGTRALGMVLGTGIGGLLTQPVLQYPGVFSSTGLFARYPFLLPNIFGAMIAVITMLLVIFWLPETKDLTDSPTEQPSSRINHEGAANQLPLAGNGTNALYSPRNILPTTQTLDYEYSQEKRGPDDVAMIKLAAPGSVRTPMLMADLKPGQESLSGINESLCNATVFGVLFLGCTLGMLRVGYDEVFPLWAVSTTEVGGLGWGAQEIGKVLFVTGIALGVLQYTAVPRLLKRLGLLNWQRFGCVLGIAAFITTPNAKHLSWNEASLKAACFGSTLFANFAMEAISLAIKVASTNIVTQHHRGKLSGLLNTMESAGRALGPASFANVYAWSISRSTEDWRWVDNHLIFYASTVVMAVIAEIARRTLTSDMYSRHTKEGNVKGRPACGDDMAGPAAKSGSGTSCTTHILTTEDGNIPAHSSYGSMKRGTAPGVSSGDIVHA